MKLACPIQIDLAFDIQGQHVLRHFCYPPGSANSNKVGLPLRLVNVISCPFEFWKDQWVSKLSWGGSGFLLVRMICKHSITQKTADCHSIQPLSYQCNSLQLGACCYSRYSVEPIQLPPVHLSGWQIIGWRSKRWCVKGANCEEIGGTKQTTNGLVASGRDEFNPWPGLWFWSVCLDWGCITVKA